MKRAKRQIKKGLRGLLSGIMLLLVLLAIAITVADFVELPIPTWDRLFEMVGIGNEQDKYEQTDKFELHVIDVGNADCILVRCEGEDMLIDAGDTDSAWSIKRYLKKAGADRFKYVVATHPHSDHIGSMHSILKKYETDQVIMGDIPEALTPTADCYDRLLSVIEDKNIKVKKGEYGTSLKLGSAKIEIISPVEDFADEGLNNYSLVLKIKYGKNSFLLMGDAEEKAEQEMLKNGDIGRCDVLKVGHHGSSTSTCEDFLDAAGPDYALISVGRNNSYGHPNKSVLNSLKNCVADIFRTDSNGDIIVFSDGKKITVRTEKGNKK